jgi:hypothetical protein
MRRQKNKISMLLERINEAKLRRNSSVYVQSVQHELYNLVGPKYFI